MGKKYALILFILLAGAAQARAAGSGLVYKWVSSNEYYAIMPTPVRIHYTGSKVSETAHPWGFGIRAVGDGETVSRTGALQVQVIKIDNRSLDETNTFYIFDLLLGAEFKTAKVQDRRLRFTASALADVGLSNTNFFLAPQLSAGLLYATDLAAETPTGFTCSVFWRPTDIALSDVGNGVSASLRPAVGVKLGYIFEGFWTTKAKE